MSYDPNTKTMTCDMGRCPASALVRDNAPGENIPVSGRTVPEGNWTIVGSDLLAHPERAATYCPEHT